MFYRRVNHKNSQNLQKNTCIGVSLKLQDGGQQKKDSDTGVFLWFLRISLKKLIS